MSQCFGFSLHPHLAHAYNTNLNLKSHHRLLWFNLLFSNDKLPLAAAYHHPNRLWRPLLKEVIKLKPTSVNANTVHRVCKGAGTAGELDRSRVRLKSLFDGRFICEVFINQGHRITVYWNVFSKKQVLPTGFTAQERLKLLWLFGVSLINYPKLDFRKWILSKLLFFSQDLAIWLKKVTS